MIKIHETAELIFFQQSSSVVAKFLPNKIEIILQTDNVKYFLFYSYSLRIFFKYDFRGYNFFGVGNKGRNS